MKATVDQGCGSRTASRQTAACGLEKEEAKDRARWRSVVRKGTERLKQDMIEERGEKRLGRKNPAMAAPTGSTCHLCARPCQGNAGLQAHL